MSVFYRTVMPCNGGVNSFRKPHLLNDNEWVTLTQMRSRGGSIVNFPGWKRLFAGANVNSFGTLIAEYVQNDSTTFLLFGGSGKIYLFNSVTQTITDISGGLVFGATRDEPWTWMVYNDQLYLMNKQDGMCKFNGIGNIQQIALTPRARSINVLNNHICVLNVVNDPAIMANPGGPTTFMWAAEASDIAWLVTPNTTTDQGQFDLSFTPDIGMALNPLGIDLIAYKEDSLVDIAFVGGNEVFGIRNEIDGFGIVSPYGSVAVETGHLNMGQDRFWGYQGGVQVDDEIGLPIRANVFNNLHPTLRTRVRSAYISATHEALFMYPSLAAVTDPDTCVIYNDEEKLWYGPFPIDCSMALGAERRKTSFTVPEGIFIKSGGNIEEIDELQQADDSVNLTRVIESCDISPRAAAVAATGQIIALPMGVICQVNFVWLEIESSSGVAQLQVGYKMDLGVPIAFTPFINIDLTGKSTIQVAVPRPIGRWYRIRLTMPLSTILVLNGYQYEFAIVGMR